MTAAPPLRLVWPRWQGAGTESVRSLAPEFPFDIARRGYSVGTKVLQAVLSTMAQPLVPVEMGNIGLEERDGIEAKAVLLQQLRSALAIISEHEPARILTVACGRGHRPHHRRVHTSSGDAPAADPRRISAARSESLSRLGTTADP
jgi:hypothetical protein